MTHQGAQATPSAPGMIQTADGQLCFPLEGGVRPMPAVGLGTFQVKGEAAYDAVAEALRVRQGEGSCPGWVHWVSIWFDRPRTTGPPPLLPWGLDFVVRSSS